MKTLASLLLFPTLALGQVVTGTSIHPTCAIAENYAMSDALMKAKGLNVSSIHRQTCKNESCKFEKESELYAAGQITEVLDKNISQDIDGCRVTVYVRVSPSQTVKAAVEGDLVYTMGEPYRYRIQTDEPLFMYVFVVREKNVELIYPFDYNTSVNRVKGNFSLVTQKRDYAKVFELDSNVEKNTIVFIFAKYKVDLNLHRLNKEQIDEMIKSIPVYSRKVFYNEVSIYR
jgi:hypothetical protein